MRVLKHLSSPVRFIKGVGPGRARHLARLGIETVEDLLYHFPRRYEDRIQLDEISALQDGQKATVAGTVLDIRQFRARSGLRVLKVSFSDGTGMTTAVWFNQDYLAKRFRRGEGYIFHGLVRRVGYVMELQNPEFEPAGQADPMGAGRIVPVYPLTTGLSQKVLRNIIFRVVEEFVPLIPETLSPHVLERRGLIPLSDAFREVHFPRDEAGLRAAKRRLAFEEAFFLQLAFALVRAGSSKSHGIRHCGDGSLVGRFRRLLPFQLTPAQERVCHEIFTDMESDRPMNRLVQGDVGSGKTVVATLALLKAVEAGSQAVLMVPTEILAEQQFALLKRQLEPLGVTVALLTGSLAAHDRKDLMKGLRDGRVQVAVGTHALIQDPVQFHRLGLVVTDEQHRFGVRQRSLLVEKGENPDVLVLSATPIPRTLTLTVFGDLDLSIVDNMPPGRKNIITKVYPESERGRVYAFARKEIKRGRQVYVVCPLVEESPRLEAQAATAWVKRLRQAMPDCRIGLVHGGLPSEDKDAVMRDFRAGALDLLVATTVIEVGVDVPNATVVIVESAGRFGLAQLHQLRGRVGRGVHQSYCFLLSSGEGEVQQRLGILEKTGDGFRVAEADLAHRGPGEVLGTRQHGFPEFRLLHPIADLDVLEQAREEAGALMTHDPELVLPEHSVVRERLLDKFGEVIGFATIG